MTPNMISPIVFGVYLYPICMFREASVLTLKCRNCVTRANFCTNAIGMVALEYSPLLPLREAVNIYLSM